MSKKMKIVLVIILLVFIENLKAQYWVPFITVDPDGYTNIREQPNASSKIVGKVYRYQIFYFAGKDDDDDISNYSTNNWLPIHTGQVSGYIYRKKILNIFELPKLITVKSVKYFDKNGRQITDSGSIVCVGDTLEVTMQIQPFDRTKHQLRIRIDHDGEHVSEIDGQDFYGTDYRMPDREIKSIEISYNGKKKFVEQSKIGKCYNPNGMSVCLGPYGELYLCITGGGDAAAYGVWFSIVGNKVLSEWGHVTDSW